MSSVADALQRKVNIHLLLRLLPLLQRFLGRRVTGGDIMRSELRTLTTASASPAETTATAAAATVAACALIQEGVARGGMAGDPVDTV
jgi:hypothetical protein